VHYWADLQSMHGLRCYGNTINAWQSPAVTRQAHRMHYACRRRLPSLAIKSTHLQRGRSISSILRGVVARTRNVSEYVLVLALCLVYNGHHTGFTTRGLTTKTKDSRMHKVCGNYEKSTLPCGGPIIRL